MPNAFTNCVNANERTYIQEKKEKEYARKARELLLPQRKKREGKVINKKNRQKRRGVFHYLSGTVDTVATKWSWQRLRAHTAHTRWIRSSWYTFPFDKSSNPLGPLGRCTTLWRRAHTSTTPQHCRTFPMGTADNCSAPSCCHSALRNVKTVDTDEEGKMGVWCGERN